MGIIKGILVALATLGTLFGGHTQPVTLGSAVPSIQALFETSLQASITSNATSATLVSGTDLAGNNLSGYYCFTIDAGTVQNEFVCGNASGTALTNLVRGVNPALGITANTSLQFAHRRGADVKMTDAPYLSIYSNIFNGTQGIPGTLYYDSHPTSTASTTIVDKNYVDTSVIGGGVPATSGKWSSTKARRPRNSRNRISDRITKPRLTRGFRFCYTVPYVGDQVTACWQEAPSKLSVGCC